MVDDTVLPPDSGCDCHVCCALEVEDGDSEVSSGRKSTSNLKVKEYGFIIEKRIVGRKKEVPFDGEIGKCFGE